ncbi:MAG: hypothetical protein ABSC72_11685 [Methylovirgula sp.]|jgi:hypothetical protein
MAKARSPAYPAIGLKEAIEAVTRIYKEDYQNPIPREVAAKHMGYSGLNGKSLGALSALLKYGLLEGRGNDTRVSDRAVHIIAYEPGTTPRADAIQEAMTGPELFVDLDLRFQNGRASDQAIRAYLLTQKFIPAAADHALRSYRETKALVTAESEAYNKLLIERGGVTGQAEVHDMEMIAQTRNEAKKGEGLGPIPDYLTRPIQEKFSLDEGEVTLTLPSRLSAASYQDLEDRLTIILRGVKRRMELSDRLRKVGDEEEAAN